MYPLSKTSAGTRSDYSSSGGPFDLDLKKELIENYEVKMSAPDFWDDNVKAQAVIGEMNAIKTVVEQYEGLASEEQDLEDMLEILEEEADESMIAEWTESVK